MHTQPLKKTFYITNTKIIRKNTIIIQAKCKPCASDRGPVSVAILQKNSFLDLTTPLSSLEKGATDEKKPPASLRRL
jgi:hypothetical protein